MSRKKILLVDDVHLIIELEKAFLKGLAVDILVARNGEEALDVVQREHPDLIYLDLNMPVMDGPTCCRILKADPATREIPVIMVTTAGRPEDELLCRSSGCDDYITKPINGKLFLDKGRSCLADFDRRRSRHSYATAVEFLQNGEPQRGMTADISKGGVYVAAPINGMPDDPVDLSFAIPQADGTRLIAARGRVAWRNSADEPKKPSYPPGFGVEFTDIDLEAIASIERFFETTPPDTEE